ncbi:hypothetical protein GW17_00015118 [Ensete ventricosum]|nr:hypothetical protein GW17_00015118 [Ensete ventricosum]
MLMHALLQIHHLAVNALLKSSQVEETDGGSLFCHESDSHSAAHDNETDYDETSSCAPAFQVLKQLIQRCISDAVASGNVFADAILQHLYRWLCRLSICSYCNDCRDLDFRHDSILLEDNWRCVVPHCGQPYNREKMENALLQIVRQRERLYHLQDLVCDRCRQVKAAHLVEQCACGGSFRCHEDLLAFLGKMQVFLSIAACQKFQLLHDCTSWILQDR